MRKINRAVKIRIYPNKEQITQIEKTIGCSRFLYNRMLADKIRYYQEEKKMLKNTPAGYKKRISMAERSGFSCAGECTVKSGRGFPEIFPGTGSGISAL
ncbi:MAG: helix-turn-helix domain-containing protein [Blautia faecis]